MPSKFFYSLILLTSCQVSNVAWDHHIINNSGSGDDGVNLADYNNDDQTDIVTRWKESGYTKLYLHHSVKQFRNKWPSEFVGTTRTAEDTMFADMNNGRLIDIIS